MPGCMLLFSELSPGTPGSPRPFLGTGKVKTIFVITLRHHLPFSLSFSHECRKWVSMGYDDT